MNDFGGLFRGKKVLITGHTGFKGSWLAIWLKQLGAEVTGYALAPNQAGVNFATSRLPQRMNDLRGDVRDYQSVLNVFEKTQPEIVFHLAAQPIVMASYQSPKDTFDINIGGTVNVLEAIRCSHSVKVAVLVTSDKCYENKEWVWGYRENDPMGGFDPYSSSKGAMELVIAGYRNSFFNPAQFLEHGKAIASVRAGNVIGGGDLACDRIIPDCIRALQNRQPVVIRQPAARRPWQYVLEPLHGYLLLAQKMWENPGQYCEGWNFGPEQHSVVSVSELAKLVVKAWGSGELQEPNAKNQLHEAMYLSLDCSKAKNRLGWTPVLNLEEAVAATVAWYKKANQSGYTADMYHICVEQIHSYQRRFPTRLELAQ